MDPILQRFRLRITRGWALLMLIVGAVIAAAFWIGPLRPVPAELQLLALTPAGSFVSTIAYDEERARPSTTPGASARFPLVLGVRNVGARPARPTALYLSIPARFRLLDRWGTPLIGRHDAGNPLVRYKLELAPEWVTPGAEAKPLAPGDTLWLEPSLPSYYCTFITEGVPDFVPAPAYDAELIAQVGIFYSFSAASTARQAGLLNISIDPALLRVEPAQMPPNYPILYQEPETPRPELGPLIQAGARVAQCGDPDQAVELHTILWETTSGGRFFVIYTGGAPRKYLFDLNHDGIIELEMWDTDGDGLFEASRQARFRTPPFLIPAAQLASAGDASRPDSAWLRNFNDVAAGPFRFVRPPRDTSGVQSGGLGPTQDTLRSVDRALIQRPDTVRRDTLSVRQP
jgi:hypothetical protein